MQVKSPKLAGAPVLTLSKSIATTLARVALVGSLLVINGVATRRMSQERFGFWAILISLPYLLQVFEMGFRSSLGNRLSALMAEGEASENKRRDTFLAVFVVEILFGVCGGILCVILLPLIPWTAVFKIQDPLLAAEAGRMLPLIAACLFANLPFSLWGAVFYSYLEIGMGSFLAGFQAVFLMLVFCASAWLLPFEQIVRNYFVAYLATNIAFTAWAFFRRRWAPRIPPWRDMLAIIGSLWHRSAEFFLCSFCGAVTSLLGIFVSGTISGLAAAGDFSLIQRVFSLFISLHTAFMTPLSPFITRIARAGEWVAVRAELRKYIWRVWPLLFPLAGGLMFLAHPLVLRLWTGRWITDYPVAGYLLAWACFNGLANTYALFLNSLGIVRVQAAFAIFMILPTVYLPVYLGKWLGVPGIALATALSAVPSLLIYPYYTMRTLREQRMRV